ncbi:MAG: GNAT family N-acetyltransferase [Nitriliruptoraceae bacterium]
MTDGDDPERPDLDDPFAVAPGGWHRRTTLRDGTRVLLRQIRPEDRDRLAAGLSRLSPTSRYLRFHADVAELTDRQLDYLTDVDHVEHEALVALDRDAPEIPGVGVARYIRDPYERQVAEAAVTVADEYQGRGAGTLLLGALAARARAVGIEVFRNYVLASNEVMLEVFDDLGAVRERESDRLWRVDLALPEHERDLPDSPAGRAFMAAARGGHRLASLFPPIWPRRTDRGRLPRTTAEAIDEEIRGLREELAAWLLARDQRANSWPDAGLEGSTHAPRGTTEVDDTRSSQDEGEGAP